MKAIVLPGAFGAQLIGIEIQPAEPNPQLRPLSMSWTYHDI